jgi:phosphoribosylformylglycinamidine cyclo-ligase
MGGDDGMTDQITYKDAGVDIDQADAFIRRIRPLVKATHRPGVLGEIGGFGGLFHLNAVQHRDPVLVSSTDGVGTKVKIAILMGRHDTIGIDLVAMCANDIIVHGAAPLFFLDYLAMGQLNAGVATDILKGIAHGCQQARCSLLGGETAEMPGLYQTGDYDLAGFIVGVVERDRIIDGSDIAVGHRLIGLAASGLHSNGYSLVRKVFFDKCGYGVQDYIPDLGGQLGEELLKPTRIYVETVLNLRRDFPLSGICHITGGGLMDNLPRILPKSCRAVIYPDAWPTPPIFSLIQEKGNIPAAEMRRTFNNGIGLVLVVADNLVDEVLLRLKGLKEPAYVMGEIVSRKKTDPAMTWGE